MTAPDYNSDNDKAIVARVLGGEVDAYAALLDRYGNYVAAVVNKHVPEDRVTEVVHEVFVRGYKSLPGLRNGHGFKPWIASIAVRACCDFWREQYRSREVPISDLAGEHQEWLDIVFSDRSRLDFDRLVRQKEAVETLNRGLARLSPRDRIVLELCYLEGLTAREAAAILKWSVVNVKVRCFRARKKLEKALLAK